MSPPISRRSALAGAAAVAAGPLARAAAPHPPPFRLCLNTSTVRRPGGDWGRQRDVVELIDIAQKAGYRAIEPWVSELRAYVTAGRTAAELGRRFADAGLEVPDVVGFAVWAADDPAARADGLEQAKKDFALVAAVGGKRLAAPPVGATGRPNEPPVADLFALADRYRPLLDLGKAAGVTPLVEVWGHSKTLARLGEALLVAAECGAAGGAVLPDIYHLYKGGSGFAGLAVGAAAAGIVHVNDYPAVGRAEIADRDRVFPGDGVAPLADVFRSLAAAGYRGHLSLELFNHAYWRRDPYEVAREGLRKLTAAAAG